MDDRAIKFPVAMKCAFGYKSKQELKCEPLAAGFTWQRAYLKKQRGKAQSFFCTKIKIFQKTLY